MSMMRERETEVVVLELWDGIRKETNRIALLQVNFLALDNDLEDAAIKAPRMVFSELLPELDRIGAVRFPNMPVKFNGVAIKKGSLEVVVELFLVCGALYNFVKDYPDLREGFKLLVNDIDHIGDILSARITKLFKK